MAVTAELYANFFQNALSANINDIEETDGLECMLLDANHSFDEDDEFVDDIVANEVTDSDYSRQTLTNVVLTRNINEVNLDADDISFGTNINLAASYAVIYQAKTDDTDSLLLFHVDFDGQEEAVDGAFELQVNESGLFDIVT